MATKKQAEVRRFRNTKTKLVELVTDEKTIELMENSERYEEVTDEKAAHKKDADKSDEKDKE